MKDNYPNIPVFPCSTDPAFFTDKFMEEVYRAGKAMYDLDVKRGRIKDDSSGGDEWKGPK
jgi:hypothetical protein